MKRWLYEYIPAWLLIGIFGLIVLHAPMTVVVGTNFPAIATAVKAWKEVLLVAAVVLIAIDVARRGRFRDFLRDRMLQLAVGYVLLHFVLVAIMPGGVSAALAGLATDVRFVAYFVAVYVFLRLYPAYYWRFIAVGIGGAAVVLGFALLQLVLPKDFLKILGYGENTIMPYLTVDKNPDYVRLNSTLRGPNPLGAYAMMALAGVAAYASYYWRRFRDGRPSLLFELLTVGAVTALWASYSRSALIAAIVAVTVVLLVRFGARLNKRHWLAIGGVLVVLGAAGYLARHTSFVANVILHDNPSTGASLDSNTAHAASLMDGISRMLRQPLGGGVGSTGSASLFSDSPLIIENQYLFVAHEAGWLGLLLFAALLTVVFGRLWRFRNDWFGLMVFASGLGMLIIGLLLPVWVDDTVAIIWWGCAAIVLAKGGVYERTTNKKAA